MVQHSVSLVIFTGVIVLKLHFDFLSCMQYYRDCFRRSIYLHIVGLLNLVSSQQVHREPSFNEWPFSCSFPYFHVFIFSFRQKNSNEAIYSSRISSVIRTVRNNFTLLGECDIQFKISFLYSHLSIMWAKHEILISNIYMVLY